MMNKYGDKGSPCRSPLELGKNPAGSPFTNTENLTVDMQLHIHSLHLVPKPIFSITLIKNCQLTLSYAFSISSLQIRPFFPSFFHESITSFAIRDASKIYLPETKAFWSEEITPPITFLILLANTLAKSLYNPPNRLIGLKSPSSSAPPFLGIRTKNVALRLLRKVLCSWNS